VTYWDTSAIFKLYVSESDSPFFLDLLAQTQEQVTSSVILRLEVLCAAWRKEQSGEIKTANSVVRELDQHIEAGKVVLIPYGPNIVAEAEKLLQLIAGLTTRRMLRSLDTIHLASALESKATSFVATDIRLREIAALAGLKVLP
jgi:predicted nucleic acid-binding protein